MTEAAHKEREREHPHRGVVVGFSASTSAHVPQISTTTMGTDAGWLMLGGVRYSESGGTLVLPNTITGTGTSSIREQGYAEEFAEQILRLAKEPPVAEFESTEELMDWLDDID
jgi:hypothetical protein